MLKFEKYQGTGNDFILFNEDDIVGHDNHQLAKDVCDRHFGIGADGMIVVAKSTVADIRMIYYNADGSLATMCGNGIRCFSKYVTDHQLVHQAVFTVETSAGILTVNVVESNAIHSLVRVNMGQPSFIHETVPTLDNQKPFINQVITLGNQDYTVSSIFIGTIHTVLFVDYLDEEVAKVVGPEVEHYHLYPSKTNVNFCKIVSSNTIEVLTWEKGVGITLACGTGATACAFLSQLLYGCEPQLKVVAKGGILILEREEDGMYMTGPATFICKGTYLK